MGVFKNPAQAFEAGDFLNIFLRFWDFEAHFLIKIYLLLLHFFSERIGQ